LSNIKEHRLPPIIKWAGGKEQELKYIHPRLSQKIDNYYEPFIGGGAVYFSINAKKMFINDKSDELIGFYNLIATQDRDFFRVVEEIMYNWNLLEGIVQNNKDIFVKKYIKFSKNLTDETKVENWVYSFILQHSKEFKAMFDVTFNVNIKNFLNELKKNILSKMKRMKKIEPERGKLQDKDILDNMEAALKSAFYMHFRHLYNNIQKYQISKSFATAIFFFIRNYAYSGMFRYNKSGLFNVPYGGIGYNRKNFSKRVESLKNIELVKHLEKTTIENLDFEEFFEKNRPSKDDFIFVDPPYDNTYSSYSNNSFTRSDQERLSDFLINRCEAKWMMVIKNTDFIHGLYRKDNIDISSFDKKYLLSIQNRNIRDAKHMIITNYES